jgi:hypothetical protein
MKTLFKLTTFLFLVILLLIVLESCKSKDNVQPKSNPTLTLKINDTTSTTNNLVIDYTHLKLTDQDYIEITCDNFQLTFLKQNGQLTPYICKINYNNIIFDYEDYNYNHGVKTDALSGKINSTVLTNSISGNFDLIIANSYGKIHLIGNYSM